MQIPPTECWDLQASYGKYSDNKRQIYLEDVRTIECFTDTSGVEKDSEWNARWQEVLAFDALVSEVIGAKRVDWPAISGL